MALKNRKSDVNTSRLAFSLAELLVVIALICTIGGYLFSVLVFPTDKSEMYYHIEQQNAKIWLERKLLHALIWGRRFYLDFSTSSPRNKLILIWEDTGKIDEFSSDLFLFKVEGTSSRFYYSPTFHTLTPAIRIFLLRDSVSVKKQDASITISGYCRVRFVDV